MGFLVVENGSVHNKAFQLYNHFYQLMNSDRTTEKAKLQAKKQRLTQAYATLSCLYYIDVR